MTTPTPGTLATAFSTMVGSSPAAGQFGVVSVIIDVDAAVVLEVDLVDQAELVDVGRDFRVEHRLQRGDDFGAEPLGLLRRQRRMRFHVGGFDFGRVDSCEQFPRLDQRLCQMVDLFPGIIHAERGAAGGRDIEPL